VEQPGQGDKILLDSVPTGVQVCNILTGSTGCNTRGNSGIPLICCPSKHIKDVTFIRTYMN